MYRSGDVVHVQHALLLFDQLITPFDPSEPWISVPERTVRDEDGFRLSEWHVRVSDLSDFMQNQ